MVSWVQIVFSRFEVQVDELSMVKEMIAAMIAF